MTGATAFGACVGASGHVCGLDAAACAAGETWVDPRAAAAQYDVDCTCADVVTGSCVDALTGTPRCAVDADSCDAGDAWVDARATLAGGADCALCDAAALVWPSSAPTTAAAVAAKSGFGGAEFGGCYDAALNARRCEYNSSYCGAGETWMTPTELAYNGQQACECEDAEIGACYDVAARFRGVPSKPSHILELKSGRRFDDRVFSRSRTSPRATSTRASAPTRRSGSRRATSTRRATRASATTTATRA